MRTFSRSVWACALLAGTLTAAGCSSSSTATGGAAGEASEVRSYLRSWYWWLDQAPDVDVSALNSAEEALEALRYKDKDRFSFVEKASSYNAFFRDGTTIAFGITYRTDSDRLTLRLVQPNSPAANAGLKRADAITAIDGASVTSLIAANTLADAFGPTTAGIARTLTVLSAGVTRDITLTKAQFPLSHVLASKLQAMPSGAFAAYLYLGAFTDQTRAQWRDALLPLAASGTTRYVVDLRYNGGGTMLSAAQVASSLAPALAENLVFARITHNRLHQGSNQDFRYSGSERLSASTRIAFIVDKSTCSAAEALIQGLKPFVEVGLIGNTTCGKPVGFTPQVIAAGDKVLNAVDFSLSNARADTDYFDGLTPTCSVSDDLGKALGDPSEAMNASALYWLDTGSCPVLASSAERSSKSIDTPGPEAPAQATRPPRSTADYFGLR